MIPEPGPEPDFLGGEAQLLDQALHPRHPLSAGRHHWIAQFRMSSASNLHLVVASPANHLVSVGRSANLSFKVGGLDVNS
jgi:hypothetical protein